MRGTEYERVSVSRIEEACGWLGAQGFDPQNDPRENWRDDPSAVELAEMDRDERVAA